jgi:hypothetical protein
MGDLRKIVVCYLGSVIEGNVLDSLRAKNLDSLESLHEELISFAKDADSKDRSEMESAIQLINLVHIVRKEKMIAEYLDQSRLAVGIYPTDVLHIGPDFFDANIEGPTLLGGVGGIKTQGYSQVELVGRCTAPIDLMTGQVVSSGNDVLVNYLQGIFRATFNKLGIFGFTDLHVHGPFIDNPNFDQTEMRTTVTLLEFFAGFNNPAAKQLRLSDKLFIYKPAIDAKHISGLPGFAGVGGPRELSHEVAWMTFLHDEAGKRGIRLSTYLVHFAMPGTIVSGEGVDQFLGFIKQLADAGKRLGVCVSFEQTGNSPDQALYLLRAMEGAGYELGREFGYVHDLAHMTVDGAMDLLENPLVQTAAIGAHISTAGFSGPSKFTEKDGELILSGGRADGHRGVVAGIHAPGHLVDARSVITNAIFLDQLKQGVYPNCRYTTVEEHTDWNTKEALAELAKLGRKLRTPNGAERKPRQAVPR